jgi:hypothetical protein
MHPGTLQYIVPCCFGGGGGFRATVGDGAERGGLDGLEDDIFLWKRWKCE